MIKREKNDDKTLMIKRVGGLDKRAKSVILYIAARVA
jgi:hypothetical protein